MESISGRVVAERGRNIKTAGRIYGRKIVQVAISRDW